MASWWTRVLRPWDDDPAGDGAGDPILAAARTAQLLDATFTLSPWELPPVVAARELCADTTAMLPLVEADERTGRPTGDRPAVLRRPDPAQTYRVTMERIVNMMTRHGRAWLDITADGSDGYPLAFRVLDSDRVNAHTRHGRVVDVWVDGEPASTERVRHVPMIVDDDPAGVSPLQRIATAVEQLANVYGYSASYYSTGYVPPYALIHPQRLRADQVDKLAAQWAIARSERRPAVLSGGVELHPYAQPNASDALLLDAIAQLDATVARAMLIPPSLLNVRSQSTLTYSTTVGELQRWLAIGLHPMILSRIEAALSDMRPRGRVARFDTSPLTRMPDPTDDAGTRTGEEVPAR